MPTATNKPVSSADLVTQTVDVNTAAAERTEAETAKQAKAAQTQADTIPAGHDLPEADLKGAVEQLAEAESKANAERATDQPDAPTWSAVSGAGSTDPEAIKHAETQAQLAPRTIDARSVPTPYDEPKPTT